MDASEGSVASQKSTAHGATQWFLWMVSSQTQRTLSILDTVWITAPGSSSTRPQPEQYRSPASRTAMTPHSAWRVQSTVPCPLTTTAARIQAELGVQKVSRTSRDPLVDVKAAGPSRPTVSQTRRSRLTEPQTVASSPVTLPRALLPAIMLHPQMGPVPAFLCGCFPREWLDNWGARFRPGQESRAAHWARGRRALGRISDAAVQGCHQIWRAVTELWRQDQQTSRHRRGRTKAQRLAHCELLRGEAELMGHEVAGLHPLELQTYLRAVDELTARREATRDKRQLAKPDREIMRWRTWGMRRIMEWWRAEAEQRLGNCKRGGARRGPNGNDG